MSKLTKASKHLNDINGFKWASEIDERGYAKTSICGETFWIKNGVNRDGIITGNISNHLIFSKDHGLSFGDKVIYKPAGQ